MTDKQVDDLNIASQDVLITPNALKEKLPLSDNARQTVISGRETIRNILDRKDHRLFVVIGPCSIHDTDAAMEYAARLKKLADEDATRRIKQLEDQVEGLRKQVANNKQEEETLIIDMEVTGQALEDMQEQNSRLIQQLREKDDANFKLMSERIKSNQIARLAREEKEMYIQQVATLTTQVNFSGQLWTSSLGNFPGGGSEPGGEEVGGEGALVAN